VYLSIDFEDYHHDLKRSLGISRTCDIKSKELLDKYKQINDLLTKYGKGANKKATFFCTGILADKEPDLIRQISNDGHEIACHYYYHDVVKNDSNIRLYDMLSRARDSLQKVSNNEVRGFRAPYFAINKKSPEQYKIVEKVFDYDSSLHCNSSKEVEDFKKKMLLTKLKIIPLYSYPFFGFNLKLGGTFLKLFPLIYSRIMINNSLKEGFNPHIYMHPYEFDIATNFKVEFSDLMKLGLKKAIYWQIRQNQWLRFRNASTKSKLALLIKKNPLEGRLISSL